MIMSLYDPLVVSGLSMILLYEIVIVLHVLAACCPLQQQVAISAKFKSYIVIVVPCLLQ